MAMTGIRSKAFATYRFHVKIDGGPAVAEFGECSGLEFTVKTDEVREGGQNAYVERLPGRIEYGNLVLRRGYVTSNEFYLWCRSALNRAKIERYNVTVALVSQSGESVMAWTFVDAYPVKWSGPAFKAGDNAVAIESMELAHRGLLG